MIHMIPFDTWLNIINFLDSISIWNLLQASSIFARIFGSSRKFLLNYEHKITSENLKVLSARGYISSIPFRNISITCFKEVDCLQKVSKLIKNYKESIEILEINDFRRIPCKDFKNFFNGFTSLRILKIRNCGIAEEVHLQCLNQLPCLEEIFVEKCDGNIYKLFKSQKTISKLSIRNTDWTWNGFPHDEFNDLVKTLVNFKWMVLDGNGTGSYFDCDHFPYSIRKLDTTLITFHWYVGIRTGRVSFLKSQMGSLKELKIHQLPYDFDGGEVLKFIIESMNLETFYYGDIPLIVSSQKQEVYEFCANEIQITSLYEMFLQFPSIKSFKLLLTQTDVDSSEVERVINPYTDRFNNVDKLEVIDRSGYRRILGVYLGLMKNFRNIKRIRLETQDRNINVLLQEFLPQMTQLTEISLNSKAPRIEERFQIIRNYIPELKTLCVAQEFVADANIFFGNDVDVQEIIVNDN